MEVRESKSRTPCRTPSSRTQPDFHRRFVGRETPLVPLSTPLRALVGEWPAEVRNRLNNLFRNAFGYGVSIGPAPNFKGVYDGSEPIDLHTLLSICYLEGFEPTPTSPREVIDPPDPTLPVAANVVSSDLVTTYWRTNTFAGTGTHPRTDGAHKLRAVCLYSETDACCKRTCEGKVSSLLPCKRTALNPPCRNCMSISYETVAA